MDNILNKIIERKKEEIELLKKNKINNQRNNFIKRSFIKALQNAPALAIIAEVKKASPSKGIIRKDFDPVAIAKLYEKSGTHAISVLTDRDFFQGSNEYLQNVRKAINLPIIRKDFIVHSLQVEETYNIGADAMLLIAAALDDSQMKDLYDQAIELDIDPLIEIHSFNELERVLKINPQLIGINNRNLSTFKVDINLSLELVKNIPSNITVVSESGIENRNQALVLKSNGIKALLVGESIVKLSDPSDLIKELKCED